MQRNDERHAVAWTTLTLALASALLATCTPHTPDPASDLGGINGVLDNFHQAAAEADEDRYLGHMSTTGVFLGTDGGERWTKEEFRTFVRPYFSQGQGWTYTPTIRHVTVSGDGTFAWFDELLENSSYGTCRGTGALQRIDGVWKIEQYSLTIPVPNELAKDLVSRIRALAESEVE